MTAFKKIWLGTAAAAITIPLMALPASAAPCSTNTVAFYEGLGSTGCSVDGVTFSQISVNTTTTGGGTVSLGNITPFQAIINGALENILELNYTASAGAGQTVDIAWSYVVTGNLLNDAYLALAATDTNGGTSTVTETLSNNVTLTLLASGSTTATFTPIGSLLVLKDQINKGNGSGSADASILANGFSVVPLPGALPLFVGGLGGLWALTRRRKERSTTA